MLELAGLAVLDTRSHQTRVLQRSVTGTARREESLLDREAAQDLAPVYPATPALNSLRFGDDKYIGTGNRSGELHIAGGKTYGTYAVYPTCVFCPD